MKSKLGQSVLVFWAILSLFACTDATTPTSSTLPSVTPGTSTPIPFKTKNVSVGLGKSFAINSSNIAKSWGRNFESINSVYGQLGQNLGTNTNVNVPTLLSDVGTKYVSVTSGEIGSCGITTTGAIKCWGSNAGDATGVDKNAPTRTSDTSSVYIDISSGSYHNCGVATTGVLKCWGDGWEGKLGNLDGTGATQNSPVVADVGTLYKRVAGGRNHTCGITQSGGLKCFGTNSAGQLGDTTVITPRVTPKAIDVGVSYSEIAAGEDSTCGITIAGVLKCWGDNSSGQLGDGTITPRSTPTIIDAGTSYSKVSLSSTTTFHACGITTAGVLKCWGDNSVGQLGNGGTGQSLLPVIINAGTSYREVSAGTSSTCAITTAGLLQCWGDNSSGELGLGNTAVTRSPALVGSGF